MAAPMKHLHRMFRICRKIPARTVFVPIRTIQYVRPAKNILKLHDRNMLKSVYPAERSPELMNKLKASQCVYCGFDPTADSLHIGNLLAIITLLHCQRAGHQVIMVLGGATSQIGDPSGKTKDRIPMDLDTILHNRNSIKDSLERIFNNHKQHFHPTSADIKPAVILDNREWYENYNVLDFFATVGRHFRMGPMLFKESVKSRLKSPEGMSWTEFSYQVFQAYDWLYLHKKYNCLIQVGGSDQLGNIAAGYDLVSRVTNNEVFGLTIPLVTSITGDKLGKTAGNAVWLNADKTSPYELYQFYINLPDAEVEDYLKRFTFISLDDIAKIMKKHASNPEMRQAQKTLAEQVTRLVHGESGLQSAQRCTEALFSHSLEALINLTPAEMSSLFKSAPTTEAYLEPGTTLLEAVMSAGCFDRKVDAERVIKAGGVYVNFHRNTNADAVFVPGEHILPNGITLLRVGKKNYYVVRWLGSV